MNSVIQALTKPWRGSQDTKIQLRNFAETLGWYPSDIVEESRTGGFTTGHLFVEHGLGNSAVISFIDSRFRFDELNYRQKEDLLRISYNNLVDLHISVDLDRVNGFHNRYKKEEQVLYSGKISIDQENLRSDFYEKLLANKKISPNLKPLDDALIDTISKWKRVLSAELGNKVDNRELSNLFNTLIFARAIEDHYNRDKDPYQKSIDLPGLLLENNDCSLKDVFQDFFFKYNIKSWPQYLVDFNSLGKFDHVNKDIVYRFFNDFYFNPYAPYRYDFSIISKHALSRIYERYVSILHVEPVDQLSLFGAPIPVEEKKKSTGTFYTPQFVARFLAKYAESIKPEFKFGQISILDPAVGSGIFLRTFLEKKAENLEIRHFNQIKESFKLIKGIDVNATACDAAKLSLTLLYLVLLDELPDEPINIVEADSLAYFKSETERYSIIVANPPYVAYNTLTDFQRGNVKEFLGDLSYGRSDLYLPFIKLAVDSLVNGGLGMFVIPNTFLTMNSAKYLRRYLSEFTSIRCIVDLTEIPVFAENVYTILIIFEKIDKAKKVHKQKPTGLATIAKIQENVGEALQNILNNQKTRGQFYSIYEVNQDFFKRNEWVLLPPTEHGLKIKLEDFTRIELIFDVRTGFSSGASEVFIQDAQNIPTDESDIFVPFLDDREIEAFGNIDGNGQFFFYPFSGGKYIDEGVFRKDYPKTYLKLQKSKTKLSDRTEVKNGKLKWWYPSRARGPKFMLVPKIVTPHLVYTPKFTVDLEGKYAVSRAPFLVLKGQNPKSKDILLYYTGVLNSSVCFWYLINHSPKYRGGYAMLEPKILKDLPVPSHESVDKLKLKKIIQLVEERIQSTGIKKIDIEKKIDRIVGELYGLTKEELNFLNID